jgi:sodium/proline symporter
MGVAGFLGFLLLFGLIGLLSARRAEEGQADYLLAGRSVTPVLTALSAAATKYSGYMFVGLMGYIYTFGLSGIWLALGFFFGDLLAFSFVHARVRQAAAATGALTFADLVSRWHGGDYRVLRVAIGLLTLIFLATYAAAQFNAGSKALQVLFGWHQLAGTLIGAGVILAYCLAGGLRASIWTDAGQSLLMMAAMWLLLIIAVTAAGGIGPFIGQLHAVSPAYMDLGQTRFGGLGAMVLFAFGWLFNGIGVTGQPQVMVRFMALDHTHNTWKTGLYYFTWSGLFLAATFVVGLATRVFIVDSGGFDAELALPTLAHTLVPGLAVGVIIGGVFAASMSTADSQVLSCAAVLSDDLKLVRGKSAQRLATVAVVVLTVAIAVFASANVFTLVIFAWSALACTIGPLVILHALGRRPSQWTALAMMAAGLIVALWWRQTGFNQAVYEGLPGMAAAFAVWVGARLLAWVRDRRSPSASGAPAVDPDDHAPAP